jgi:hypothetical protein
MIERACFCKLECPGLQEIGVLEEGTDDINCVGKFRGRDKRDCDGYVRRPAWVRFIVYGTEDVDIAVKMLWREDNDCC